jgi:hypothetical protein
MQPQQTQQHKGDGVETAENGEAEGYENTGSQETPDERRKVAFRYLPGCSLRTILTWLLVNEVQ